MQFSSLSGRGSLVHPCVVFLAHSIGHETFRACCDHPFSSIASGHDLSPTRPSRPIPVYRGPEPLLRALRCDPDVEDLWQRGAHPQVASQGAWGDLRLACCLYSARRDCDLLSKVRLRRHPFAAAISASLASAGRLQYRHIVAVMTGLGPRPWCPQPCQAPSSRPTEVRVSQGHRPRKIFRRWAAQDWPWMCGGLRNSPLILQARRWVCWGPGSCGWFSAGFRSRRPVVPHSGRFPTTLSRS